MAGGVAVAVCGTPRQRERAFLEFTKILHTQNAGDVMIGFKVSQAQRIIGMAPVRIRIDVDVPFSIFF
ncbi:hypothetical protein SDC9_191294 [bioreactor metagenome]|uniref:Uncharacterized protein n=1 Tax=bioreactor metagenome TaxID=1076179 RepID=A0A645I5Q9_9ZZZZ